MSKSTIISLIPFEVNERKPVYPGNFVIPPAKQGDFEILVIGNAHAFKYIDMDRGHDKIIIDSEEVAKAIVNDYINSQLAIEKGEGIVPGLFYILGEHSKLDVKLHFSKEITKARENQLKWFNVLVRMADDVWENSRQHKAISGMQRYAAKYLNLERQWLVEPKMTKCIACRVTVEDDAVICPNCNVVLDKEEFSKLEFAKV